MSKRKKIGLNILLLLISLSITFIALEIFARIYISHLASENNVLLYASLDQLQKKYETTDSQYKTHRYLGYYLTPNYKKGDNQHNSLGYRGEEIELPKPQDRFRIVCLGGSTTYSTSIEDYRLSYPYLLEKELHSRGYNNVDVINAGCGAWSSWETLINFEFRVLDIEPDMIIFYHAINDIHPRLVWPPQAYQGDNSGRRSPNSTGTFKPRFFENSSLPRIFMIRLGMCKPHAALEMTIDKYPDTFYGHAFREQKNNNTYPQGIFQKVSAQEMLNTNLPVYYQRNIENIITVANFRNIKTILATFAWCSDFSNQPRVSSPEYIGAYKEINSLLKNIAADMDVHLFDFAAEFPAEKKYFIDGRHVNPQGSQIKAQLFADYIIHNNLIPK